MSAQKKLTEPIWQNAILRHWAVDYITLWIKTSCMKSLSYGETQVLYCLMVIRFRFFILLGDVVPKVLKYHHLIINTALAFSETPPQIAIPKHTRICWLVGKQTINRFKISRKAKVFKKGDKFSHSTILCNLRYGFSKYREGVVSLRYKSSANKF